MHDIYSTDAFEAKFTYTGSDLGAVWTPEKTLFRVWAPTASNVTVKLYRSGDPNANDLIGQLEMSADVNGTWLAEAVGNLNGVYYTYLAEINEKSAETCDPYARTTGINGQRAMVIDLAATNPVGWETDTDPHAGNAITDAVIYELHIRDLSIDESSGIRHKGKYLGLTETGTTNQKGIPTGLDHIKNLGVTHVHLLPVYDFATVDETRLHIPQFNWGYDPVNYNVPEGSYATDPANGHTRVTEMKQMVKALHDNGLSVIMDVVYNHVYDGGNFCFNRLVPGYFSRIGKDGVYSNGSGCGNDTASERSMVRKYIVDSVCYWADEYHIDGFRFDLVGLLDTETINAIVSAVHEKHPNVIFYGEGWSIPTGVTKTGISMATQQNAGLTPSFAYFSDTMRDALRGYVFDDHAKGYVSGVDGLAAVVSGCFAADTPWTKDPKQIINYASCHDNMTLFDRLTLSNPDATLQQRIRMNCLAAAICMLSQGVPFFQAGEEMLRSKPRSGGGFEHNSYNLPDSVNSLKWDDLNETVRDYYAGLIAFRKAHSTLRLTSAEEIAAHIKMVQTGAENVLAFHISKCKEKDLVVIFNPRKEAVPVPLPEGCWDIFIQDNLAGTASLGSAQKQITVAPISATVLVSK